MGWMKIVNHVTVEFIYLNSGLLRFGFVDNSLIFVGLTFNLMKLKLNTTQLSSLKSLEIRLQLADLR